MLVGAISAGGHTPPRSRMRSERQPSGWAVAEYCNCFRAAHSEGVSVRREVSLVGEKCKRFQEA